MSYRLQKSSSDSECPGLVILYEGKAGAVYGNHQNYEENCHQGYQKGDNQVRPGAQLVHNIFFLSKTLILENPLPQAGVEGLITLKIVNYQLVNRTGCFAAVAFKAFVARFSEINWG